MCRKGFFTRWWEGVGDFKKFVIGTGRSRCDGFGGSGLFVETAAPPPPVPPRQSAILDGGRSPAVARQSRLVPVRRHPGPVAAPRSPDYPAAPSTRLGVGFFPAPKAVLAGVSPAMTSAHSGPRRFIGFQRMPTQRLSRHINVNPATDRAHNIPPKNFTFDKEYLNAKY